MPVGLGGSYDYSDRQVMDLTFDEEFNGTSLDTDVWNDSWFGAPGENNSRPSTTPNWVPTIRTR